MTRIHRLVLLMAIAAVVSTACSARGAGTSPTPVPAPVTTSDDPTAGKTGIRGSATAGPTCPVERVPPDPSCAPHPVQGAVIVVRDASGAEVDRTVTNAAGMYFSAVGAGTYIVEPQPVTGIMGTPMAQRVVVAAGERATADFDYDTGIR